MESSLLAQLDLIQLIFGVVVGWVGWFMVRTLKQIDKNQADTASRLETLSREFYQLQGQHQALLCQHEKNGDK